VYKNGRLHPRTTIALAAALLLYVGPAVADDAQPIREPNRKLAARALLRVEKPETSEESWLKNLHTKKGRGFEYSHSFTLSPEKTVIFSIQGPILNKKTPGVALELRF
jgi:hypothetical protein